MLTFCPWRTGQICLFIPVFERSSLKPPDSILKTVKYSISCSMN